MIPEKLEYRPLGGEESQLCGNIIYSILTDAEIMGAIDERHAAGVRCAVITVLENGECVDGYVADQSAVAELVPFDEVRDAVNSYKINDSICAILIRDGLVSASICGKI